MYASLPLISSASLCSSNATNANACGDRIYTARAQRLDSDESTNGAVVSRCVGRRSTRWIAVGMDTETIKERRERHPMKERLEVTEASLSVDEEKDVRDMIEALEASRQDIEATIHFWIQKLRQLETTPHGDVAGKDAYHALRRYMVSQIAILAPQHDQAQEMMDEIAHLQN